MTRRVRGGLLAIAVALLIAGLAGPVRRAWDERARAAAVKASAEQVARDRAAATASFEANRTEILANVRAQLERGDFRGAMAGAGAYLQVGDPEIRQLFTKAAAAESQRQRTDHYRALVASECTETNVRTEIRKLLPPSETATAVAGTATEPPMRLTRLAGVTARDTVQARLREPPDPETSHDDHSPATKTEDRADAANTGSTTHAKPDNSAGREKVDWITRLRRDNRARPLADYVAILVDPTQGRYLIAGAGSRRPDQRQASCRRVSARARRPS